MFMNHMKQCLFATILAAAPLAWPAVCSAAESPEMPQSAVDAATVEPLLMPVKEIKDTDIDVLENKPPKAAQGASATRANQPRQLAIIVILLSTLGVATRLLWRRHLRALSVVQDADVDEEVRSN